MKKWGPLYQKKLSPLVCLDLEIKFLEVVSHFETKLDFEIEFAAGPWLRNILCFIPDGEIRVILIERHIW